MMGGSSLHGRSFHTETSHSQPRLNVSEIDELWWEFPGSVFMSLSHEIPPTHSGKLHVNSDPAAGGSNKDSSIC